MEAIYRLPKLRNGIVLLISFLLVLTLFIAPNVKATPQLGVNPGDYVQYSDVFFATNSTISLPGGPGGISHVSSLTDTVVTAALTDVKLTQTYVFDNGTNPRTVVLEGDPTTGTGNLTIFLILGGLLPGDPVSFSTMFALASTAHINDTVSRYYAGQVRPVNVVSYQSSGFGISSSASFYWDQASGLLVEANANFTIPPIPPYSTSATSLSYRLRATATNVWTSPASGDYSLDLLLSGSTTIHQGDTGIFDLNLTSYNNFADTVALQSSLSIVNSTASNPLTLSQPSSVTLVAGQATGLSQLQVSTSAATALGLYLIDVNGSSTSGLKHYVIIGIEVAAPDFSLTGPTAIDVDIGTTVDVAMAVKAEGAFAGTVQLAPLPYSMLQVVLNVTQAQLSQGAIVHVKISITAPGNLSPGPQSVIVTANGQGINHELFIFVNVKPTPVSPDFSLSPSTPSLTINTSQTASFSVTANAINGLTGTIYVFAYESTYSQSVTCTALPSSVSLTSTVTSASSQVTCHASSPGTYSIEVTGSYLTNIKHATVALTVTSSPVPDFDIIATNPDAVETGLSGVSTITITARNGFSGSVDLSDSPLPAGLTCDTINPTSLYPGTAQVSCKSNTAGTYTVTITGTSGTLVHSTTFQVKVQAKASNAATLLGLDPISFSGLVGGIVVAIIVAIGLLVFRRRKTSTPEPASGPMAAPPTAPPPTQP